MSDAFDFFPVAPGGAAHVWAEACFGLDPPDLAFGPEWRQPRPRPGEKYFRIWDAGHILRGTKCGEGTVGLLWVTWPSDSTVRFGMGLWYLCRDLGIGWRVRDAIYDFLFSDPAIHKIESEVYSSNPHSQAALHGAKARSVEEGRQRETIQVDGVYYDRILYGCTRARWAAIRPDELGSNSGPAPATVPGIEGNMDTAQVGMQGNPPVVAIGEGNPEAQKYGKLWATAEYRAVSPGEGLAQVFLQQARPKPGAEVIDFGCGTGRGALMLALLGGCKVTMVDFVRNCLDPEIEQALTTQAHALAFIKADLEHPLPVVAEYGFCADVMEHIPELRVGRVLDNILKAARHVFFSIATTEDKCGALIGERLHLTVQDYHWWLHKLNERNAVVHWSRNDEGGCCFYVSAWSTGRDVVKTGVLNVEENQVRANVQHNIAQGWDQVHPHPTNDIECMILGGGPSMPAFLEEITQKRAEGVKLITLNGAYNWALDHGLTPSAQIIVDARAFNARFTKPVVNGCKYLIASQCDPGVLEGLPKDRTLLFHTMTGLIEDLLAAQYGQERHSIPGGSTVLLRAIPLMRMLGFQRFTLYGCDSCVMRDAHHAYAQPENDGAAIFPVTTNPGGRIFYCTGWHVSQAQELMDLIRMLGDVVELDIKGDGLLAYILKTGAEMDEAEVCA